MIYNLFPAGYNGEQQRIEGNGSVLCKSFSHLKLTWSWKLWICLQGSLSTEPIGTVSCCSESTRRGASESFLDECEAMRCIWHRNLVKIPTSCSSSGFKGNELKALVSEFMLNGNLEK